MLEVRNLVKCYSTKGGVTVKALDNVSVKFPETGMVFLLGRSGSGKSTLLNVSGGLDAPDSGEIIVKGRSSKDFSTSDFDSYRNTFVGFIFQEYNILNEFTVEQNIALALQLQNKPNDKEAVNALLKQVDLEGFAKRKPNTLSGGQKQRVAIARALIKEPEIIMADEPTGALDSNTGKQVLDTLKKLSETKLVVVVSHDREFAEFYGDRIIELKDGQILSDVTKNQSMPKDASENVQVISDDTISIKNAEDITEEDVKSIVNILKKNKGEAIITASKRELADVKRACKINDDGSKDYFEDTKEVKTKEYDGKKTKFIKSRLPMSHAFKMGASGLKTKPIRLIFTVLLSVVAFLMFGVVSTFTFYNPTYSISEALKETDYPNLTLSKYYTVIARNYKVNLNTGEQTVENEYSRQYSTLFGVEELNAKNGQGKGDYAGIFNLSNDKWSTVREINMTLVGEDISIVPQISNADEYYYPISQVYGFSDPGADYMTRNGFSLIGGRYPQTPTEVAIPEYVANLFIKTANSEITSANDMIDKKIKFSSDPIRNVTFTIVGVYDVGDIPAKYDDIKDGNSNEINPKEKIALSESLTDYLTCSFNTVIYVSQDFYDEYKNRIQNNDSVWLNNAYVRGVRIQNRELSPDVDVGDSGENVYTERQVSDYANNFRFYGLDGVTPVTFSIADGQIWLSKGYYFDNVNRGTILDCVVEIVNNQLYKYDAQTKEIAEGQNSDQFWNIVNDKYNVVNFDYLEQFVTEWYPKLAKRRYMHDALVAMNNRSSRIGDGKYTSSQVYDLIAKIDLMRTDEGDALLDGEWTAIENIVFNQTEGYKEYCKQRYYAPLLEEISYNAWDNSNLIETITQELAYETPVDQSLVSMDQVINFLYNDSINSSDIDRIISVIEKWYPIVVGKSTLDVDFSVTYDYIEKTYYKNYLGHTGVLTVVGYFESDAENNVEMIVNENFVTTYGKKDDMQEFEWREVESTDYEKPADAKYNHIITLTDNSQESIESALSSANSVVIKVQNKVYTELEFFLNTINEMKTIFLILGSVFGVFAGLMLLNFISVSISAKRKDIGILRAVGARGSDVFKIFFSEAFIIATICFIIATVGASVVSGIINDSMVTIVKMKLLNFQAINALLVFAVSFGISIIATFFPVFFASKKSPVESIRAI